MHYSLRVSNSPQATVQNFLAGLLIQNQFSIDAGPTLPLRINLIYRATGKKSAQ